jgi:hypothetical protein
VIEIRVLRRIFGPKREEVAGGCRRLHNEELHNLGASQDIRVVESSRMRWGGCVAWMVEMRNSRKILIEEPEAKRPLGKL